MRSIFVLLINIISLFLFSYVQAVNGQYLNLPNSVDEIFE